MEDLALPIYPNTVEEDLVEGKPDLFAQIGHQCCAGIVEVEADHLEGEAIILDLVQEKEDIVAEVLLLGEGTTLDPGQILEMEGCGGHHHVLGVVRHQNLHIHRSIGGDALLLVDQTEIHGHPLGKGHAQSPPRRRNYILNVPNHHLKVDNPGLLKNARWLTRTSHLELT